MRIMSVAAETGTVTQTSKERERCGFLTNVKQDYLDGLFGGGSSHCVCVCLRETDGGVLCGHRQGKEKMNKKEDDKKGNEMESPGG